MQESVKTLNPDGAPWAELSDCVGRIGESASIAVSDKARDMRAAGIDVISLAAGEPDFETPDYIKQAGIQAIQDGDTRYTKVDGTDELKTAIIHQLNRDMGLNYKANQILVSSGAKQSIFNLVLAVVGQGDEVIVPAPYWVSYTDIVGIAGGTSVILQADIDQNFKITPDQLKESLTDQSRLLILNSPNNPTGMIYTREELMALGEVIRAHPRLLVVSDDIYMHIRWTGEEFCNLASACPDLTDRVIVVNGVSKSHAMTGWRIGYAAGNAALISAMKKIQSHSTSNPNSIAQHAAAVALSGDQGFLSEFVSAFHLRHDYVVKRLNQIPGIESRPADGSFYAFPNVAGMINRLGLTDDIELAEKILEQAKVAVVPGSAYGMPGYFRISYATSMEQLERAMDAIEAL